MIHSNWWSQRLWHVRSLEITLFHDLKEDKMHKAICFLSFCNFFSLMNYLLYKKQERKRQYVLHTTQTTLYTAIAWSKYQSFSGIILLQPNWIFTMLPIAVTQYEKQMALLIAMVPIVVLICNYGINLLLFFLSLFQMIEFFSRVLTVKESSELSVVVVDMIICSQLLVLMTFLLVVLDLVMLS